VPDWLLWFRRRPITAYGLAILLFVAALALRRGVDSGLPPGFPFLTFFPAVLLATLLGGTRPGLLTALLSGLAAWYFFIPPFVSFALDRNSALALGFFALIVLVDVVIIDRLMHALDVIDAERGRSRDLVLQRDTLFREMQHRIGNNLQVISALLSIQSRTIADPAARQALTDAMSRIGTVAEIQRMFHDPDTADGWLDDAYIAALAHKCVAAAGLETRVEVELSVEPLQVARDNFMAVALIVAECINNALEHGIQTRGKGVLRIAAIRDDGQNRAKITIADDGPGPAGDVDRMPAGIGTQVIRSFARQIGGEFTLRRGIGGGGVATLIFDPTYGALSRP
jgi:two-component sensor histidine kinase